MRNRGPFGVEVSTWFVVNNDAIEIRMIASSLADARAAAETLGARWFFRRRGLVNGGEAAAVWAVYDARDRSVLPDPVKVFETDTVDAPLMWAIMQGDE